MLVNLELLENYKQLQSKYCLESETHNNIRATITVQLIRALYKIQER